VLHAHAQADMSSDSSYQNGGKMEQAIQLERATTAGGHVADSSQPILPVYHRKLANPTPLGLLSFATGIFFISCIGVGARGIHTSNMLIAVMIFYGGVCQFIVGIMEFISGNTFGATVFSSYGAFNISYAMIYLPGSGIVAAYPDKATGLLTPEFDQALGLYYTAWFIVTFLFAVGAVRASWVVVMILSFFDLECLFLAAGLMTGTKGLLTAANSVGFIVAFLCYWGGVSGLYSGGATPWEIPTFPLHKEE